MRILSIGGSHFFRFIKALLDPLFIIYCILYVVVRLFREIGLPIPYINNWLTDFLFIPVVAHLALTTSRYFILHNPYYRYPLSYLLLMSLYTSVVFELVLPRYISTTTADWVDVIAYLAGGLFYFFVHQRLNVICRRFS